MTELPDGVFRFLISLFTGGLAGVWLIHDLLLLARVLRHQGQVERTIPNGPNLSPGVILRAGRRDPLIADQVFGYVMGIVIGAVGVVGTLRFNGVF